MQTWFYFSAICVILQIIIFIFFFTSIHITKHLPHLSKTQCQRCWEVLARNQNNSSKNISLSVLSHLRRRWSLSLLSCCTGFRADLRVVCLDVTLQVVQAFKLHPTLWTPQPGHGLLSLCVPGRGSSSSLVGALAVCAPDMIEDFICSTVQLLNKKSWHVYLCAAMCLRNGLSSRMHFRSAQKCVHTF